MNVAITCKREILAPEKIGLLGAFVNLFADCFISSKSNQLGQR